jgi:hypothetical protein
MRYLSLFASAGDNDAINVLSFIQHLDSESTSDLVATYPKLYYDFHFHHNSHDH